MRLWTLVTALAAATCVTGCRASIDPAARNQFQRAQEAFDRARTKDDFLRVAGMYQQIVDSGIASGAVFYNQGNAYARAQQRGRAIACYRQALRYRPRDPLLRANLQFVLPAQSTRGAPPLVEYILFWQDWISYPQKFQLTIACAAVTLALGLAAVFTSMPVWRRMALPALAVTLAAASSAAYDWYRFEQMKYGVVARDNVVARKGDSDSYEAAFTAPLSEGTELHVLERRREWVRIRLAGSQEGWVRADDLVVY